MYTETRQKQRHYCVGGGQENCITVVIELNAYTGLNAWQSPAQLLYLFRMTMGGGSID